MVEEMKSAHVETKEVKKRGSNVKIWIESRSIDWWEALISNPELNQNYILGLSYDLLDDILGQGWNSHEIPNLSFKKILFVYLEIPNPCIKTGCYPYHSYLSYLAAKRTWRKVESHREKKISVFFFCFLFQSGYYQIQKKNAYAH